MTPARGRTLIVTNDFPPRQGGIESFVAALADRFPTGRVVVFASSAPDQTHADAALPYPVVRGAKYPMLPTPAVARRAAAVLREHDCDSVIFGAAAPLGLLGGSLRRAGARRVIALTHGHECWWAAVPPFRQLLSRIGEESDVLTYISEYTRRRISRALAPEVAARMVHLPPGTDTAMFRPGAGGEGLRRQWGFTHDELVVVCVARIEPRKGQDVLIRAWPAVLARVPQARLILVGRGSYGRALRRRVTRLGLDGAVRFVGPVPWQGLPPFYAAADLFAMPCRTRRAGLEPEGLGIVFLEAAASGLAVLVGDSGGAPETCIDGQTGLVVDGHDVADVADRVCELLLDRARREEMGRRGREWVVRNWQWDDIAARLQALLEGQPSPR